MRERKRDTERERERETVCVCVQATLANFQSPSHFKAQIELLFWLWDVDDNGTLVPPTWPPEVPLAAPPLRVKPPPATNVPRRGGGHGKTRDMCYVSRATALPPCAKPYPQRVHGVPPRCHRAGMHEPFRRFEASVNSIYKQLVNRDDVAEDKLRERAIFAARTANLAELEECLDTFGLDIESRDNQGNTLFCLVVQQNEKTVAKYLLRRGAYLGVLTCWGAFPSFTRIVGGLFFEFECSAQARTSTRRTSRATGPCTSRSGMATTTWASTC